MWLVSDHNVSIVCSQALRKWFKHTVIPSHPNRAPAVLDWASRSASCRSSSWRTMGYRPKNWAIRFHQLSTKNRLYSSNMLKATKRWFRSLCSFKSSRLSGSLASASSKIWDNPRPRSPVDWVRDAIVRQVSAREIIPRCFQRKLWTQKSYHKSGWFDYQLMQVLMTLLLSWEK